MYDNKICRFLLLLLCLITLLEENHLKKKMLVFTRITLFIFMRIVNFLRILKNYYYYYNMDFSSVPVTLRNSLVLLKIPTRHKHSHTLTHSYSHKLTIFKIFLCLLQCLVLTIICESYIKKIFSNILSYILLYVKYIQTYIMQQKSLPHIFFIHATSLLQLVVNIQTAKVWHIYTLIFC